MSEEDGVGTEGDVLLGAAAEATVMAYHELALDSDKRLHLALDDTCLQFLSLVIGNGDNSLVSKALATLAALAESPECRAPMAATFGVLHCLKASVEEDNEHTEEMKSKAAELFTCLNFAYHQQRAARRRSKMPTDTPDTSSSTPAPADKRSDTAQRASGKQGDEASTKTANSTEKHSQKKAAGEALCKEEVIKDDKDTDRGSLVKSDSVESNCSSVSLSSCSQPSQKTQAARSPSGPGPEERAGGKYYRDPKHRTRMVTLHVKGMLTPSERLQVEGALVRVRGVISLVFDLGRSRIACRVRRVLDLSKLGTAVRNLNMGMELFQVITKGQGDEIEIPLCQSSEQDPASPSESPVRGDSTSVGSEDMPAYLPEEEDEEEVGGGQDPRSAVATSGASLKEAASSLFSAAASLLHQSFYW